ncbi:MAG: OmpH family outer membrane protein [Bacteroidales bacterium]|nr:OmpH family outer membrane protein [Bacteroidales bacterium]
MKKLIIFLAVIVLGLPGNSALGQSPVKLGHLNTNELFAAMPETDSAQKILEKSAQDLQTTMEELQVEYNKKYQEYVNLANEPTTSALILRTREEELQSLNTRAQNFQTQAEQDLSDQQARLFQPIQEKAIGAIEEVSRENGFTYVFDIAAGSVVFTSDESIDILPLVKDKLGLQ